MRAEQVLYDRLSGWAPLTALVGDRIYPHPAPRNTTLPLITYYKTAAVPFKASGSRAATRHAFAVACWATEYEQAKSIADEVHAALDYYSSTDALASFTEAEVDQYDDTARAYRVEVEAVVIQEG